MTLQGSLCRRSYSVWILLAFSLIWGCYRVYYGLLRRVKSLRRGDAGFSYKLHSLSYSAIPTFMGELFPVAYFVDIWMIQGSVLSTLPFIQLNVYNYVECWCFSLIEMGYKVPFYLCYILYGVKFTTSFVQRFCLYESAWLCLIMFDSPLIILIIRNSFVICFSTML